MDHCDSPTFSNPCKQRSSQGWGHSVEPESNQGRDIMRLLQDQVLDKLLRWEKSWRIDKICLVNNKTFQKTFLEKKQELKRELSKEPMETYAFGVTQTEQDADSICSSGDFTKQSLNVPLGDVDQGVNVCLFPDVLLQWSERKDFSQPCVIIYKILKGRCKAVVPRTSTKDPYSELSPNMECHISSGTPNTTEPIFRQLSKSQIFLFEYDKEAIPSRHPRHCLPYATISLTSKTEKLGEKENGNVAGLKPCEKPHQQKPMQGTRMKLSDRFSNILPSNSKLDNPKLEELRQASFMKLAKLEAVRNERFNNALLGFGSSSEDEQFQSSPKPLGTRKNMGGQKSLISHSTGNVARSAVRCLKITIANTGSHSENSDEGTGGGTVQQKRDPRYCRPKFTTREKHEWFKDNCSSKQEKSTEKRAHSRGSRVDECHPRSKVYKSSNECPSYPSKPSQNENDSRCSERTEVGDCGSKGHSHGARRGICSQGRGHFQGRGRMRYHCPEYFKSNDTYQVFDVEKDLYEAASSRSSKPQGKEIGTTTCPSRMWENMEIGNSSFEQMQTDVPFIRLESRNHDFCEGEDLDQGERRCNSATACPNLGYSKSLHLEPLSPELNNNHFAASTDNLEVQDMEIDESSKESWQQETKPKCYRCNLCDNTWTNSRASAFQAGPTLPVIKIPASVPQNLLPASAISVVSPTHGTTNPASSAISGACTQSLPTSSPIQEAVRMLEYIQQAKIAEQLALQSFLQKCASEQDSCCPTSATQTSTGCFTHGAATSISLTPLTTVYSQGEVANFVTNKEMEQEPCNEKVTLCRKDGGTTKPDHPKKPKTNKLFYGRPLITKGNPHEILLENIPGQRQPVDPRPALSVLFNRKYEIELKGLSFDEEESECGVGSSKAVRSRRKSNEASKDPRLKRTPKSDHVDLPKPHESNAPKCNLASTNLTAELKQPDSVRELSNFKQDDARTKQQHATECSPATQFLKKLQHVSCLDTSATKPESARKRQTNSKETAAQEFQNRKSIESLDSKYQKVGQNVEVLEKHTKLSGEGERSKRHNSGNGSCCTNAPVSFSPKEVYEVSTNKTKKRTSPYRERRETEKRDSLHRKSLHRRKSSHRYRSRSRSRSPHRDHVLHRRRSSELRNRSPTAQGKSKWSLHTRREERRRAVSEDLESTNCRPFTIQPSGKHNLCTITSELSSLQSSTHKATEKMSKFPADKKRFQQECFSCLDQYNQLWLKATKALTTLTERALVTGQKSELLPDILKHEDAAANIHLQLESLAKYFHQNDLEKAGIEDWNFRPLSGVPGLSEKEHLTVLYRLKEKHKQPGSDLMDLLCQKISLLENKLASLPQSASWVCGKTQLLPSVDAPMTITPSSIQQHHLAGVNFSQEGQELQPVKTVVSSRMQPNSNLQQSDQDVRKVVLGNIKDDMQASAEQWELAVPNLTSQHRWCAVVKQGGMDLDKRA